MTEITQNVCPAVPEADRKAVSAMRDHVIDQAAAFIRISRSTAEMDAVIFGSPAVLEAAIRSRLTPGQLAQLAERLTGD